MRLPLSFLVPFAIVVAATALRAVDPAPLEGLRGASFDHYQRMQPRPYVPGPVAVIDIDDESLRRIGQWPWPRVVMARLIERLRTAGAASIALDMVFAEPDRTSPARILPLWPDIAETAALRDALAAGRLPDHDDVLARTIAGNNVVAGFALGAAGTALPLAKARIATLGTDPLGAVKRADGALTSLEPIQKAAAGNAALTVIPDRDGVIRRIPLLLGVGDKVFPTLAVEALRVAQGASTFVARAGPAHRLAALVVGSHVVPTDGAGHIRFWDSGPQKRRIHPAWRVLGDGAPGVDLTGAIVFVGSSAIGIDDIHAAPLSPATLGVAIHAQAAEQILTRQFITRPAWADALEILATALIGGVLILVMRRNRPIAGAVVAALLLGGVVALCWLAYAEDGLLLAPGFIGGTVVAVYLSAVIIAYRTSDSERRRVRAAFGQYLAPALVERLSADPGLLALGGDTREVTVPFCDIRGFTEMSQTISASALTRLVNRFLTEMTEAILESGGTIDKYIGDCVMAFWNAPLDDPAHARHAIDAALAMRARLGRLNDDLGSDADGALARLAPIAMGIGIETGPCSVGNMGSEQRFNYSVMGETVNLASRLEGETKTLGVDIVIGEGACAQVPELGLRALGQVSPRGVSRPVTVYTVPDRPAS